MTPVAGALECTYDAVLREILQVFDVKRKFLFHETVHANLVRSGIEMRNRSMIAVISTLFCDETAADIS